MSDILCGADIGGTKCSIALVDASGKIMDKIQTCEHTSGNESFLVNCVSSNLKEIIERNGLSEKDLRGIGVGCAGHIRFRDGVIITTSNMDGFRDYPLRAALQEHFAVPVILDNDANAQAFGEFKFGAGKGHQDMVFVTISTGIGAGIVVNRKLLRGQTGTAGEFGHTIVEPGSELTCTCGNRGCLMACACGMALPCLYRKKIAEGKSSLLQLDEEGIDALSGELIRKGLEMGDQVSRDIVLDSAYYVGVGLYNLFQVLNPPLIVLGGGLTNWGDIYIERIRSTFYEYARDMIYDPVAIILSEVTTDAGVIGAAALTLEDHAERPSK